MGRVAGRAGKIKHQWRATLPPTDWPRAYTYQEGRKQVREEAHRILAGTSEHIPWIHRDERDPRKVLEAFRDHAQRQIEGRLFDIRVWVLDAGLDQSKRPHALQSVANLREDLRDARIVVEELRRVLKGMNSQ